MVDSVVYDKDGVSAAAVFAEMASQLSLRGCSVLDYLSQLYDKCVDLIR